MSSAQGLFLRIPPKNSNNYPKVDFQSIKDRGSISTISAENSSPSAAQPEQEPQVQQPQQTQQEPQQQQQRQQQLQPRGQRHLARYPGFDTRIQFQQQQQLSLSTHIDDNSTLYELADDLCKVVAQNSNIKDEIWRQVESLSLEVERKEGHGEEVKDEERDKDVMKEKILDDSDITADTEIDSTYLSDMASMPSAFRYRKEYEELRKLGISGQLRRRSKNTLYRSLRNLVGTQGKQQKVGLENEKKTSQLEREVFQLSLLLRDRRAYNRGLLRTISEYEDQLIEIMDIMAERHVGINKEQLRAMEDYKRQLSVLNDKMFEKYREYTMVENKSVELYDSVRGVAEYIAGLDLGNDNAECS
ncbi:DEKNAAC101472 [Brettanomyces naardenensis]|uniref:DEKNAAC101472 n=1 Tax=Brettanomyces naardenensis TaxID=13370 RepID=A0A448YHZ6_BRENA|nr:DEKNAAC101472 [Brettanomyces naardenensis]